METLDFANLIKCIQMHRESNIVEETEKKIYEAEIEVLENIVDTECTDNVNILLEDLIDF